VKKYQRTQLSEKVGTGCESGGFKKEVGITRRKDLIIENRITHISTCSQVRIERSGPAREMKKFIDFIH